MQNLEVHIDSHPEGRTRVTLKGPLDAHSSKTLRDTLDSLIQGGCRKMALDLSGVDYVASTGAMLIITLSRRLEEEKGKLVLVQPKSQVMVIFTLLGLIDLLTFVPTPEEALEKLK